VSYFIDNVSLTQAVAPGSISTLSEQALLALGVLLATGAALVLRKRRAPRRDPRS